MTAILFHHPFACSLASVITAAEGDTDIDIQFANVFTKEIQGGGSLFDYNPLGQVATLQTEAGEVITENSAILMWIQDHARNPDFKRENGTKDYYQILRWLGFCGTEMHKSVIWPIMNNAAASEQEKAQSRAKERLTFLDLHLGDRQYLVGDQVSAADAYLYWVLNISSFAKIDISAYVSIGTYLERLEARTAFSSARTKDLERGLEMSKSITNWEPVKNPVLVAERPTA